MDFKIDVIYVEYSRSLVRFTILYCLYLRRL